MSNIKMLLYQRVSLIKPGTMVYIALFLIALKSHLFLQTLIRHLPNVQNASTIHALSAMNKQEIVCVKELTPHCWTNIVLKLQVIFVMVLLFQTGQESYPYEYRVPKTLS